MGGLTDLLWAVLVERVYFVGVGDLGVGWERVHRMGGAGFKEWIMDMMGLYHSCY